MSEYSINLKGNVTSVAGQMRRSVAGLRNEIRSLPDPKLHAAQYRQAAAAVGKLSYEHKGLATSFVKSRKAAEAMGRSVFSASKARETAAKRAAYWERKKPASRGGGGSGGGGWADVLVGNLATSALTSTIGLARTATREVARLGFAFSQASAEAYDFRVTSLAGLKALGERDQEKALSHLEDLAKRTGSTLSGTVRQVTVLRQFGFKKSLAEEIYGRAADLKSLGKSQQDVEGVVMALSQIKGKGKLQQEELTQQLAERGFGSAVVVPELSRMLGKSNKDVLSMISKGKISGDVGVRAVLNVMKRMAGGREAGELGREMSMRTFEGFKTTGQRVGESFMQKLVRVAEPGFADLVKTGSKSLQGFSDWLDSKQGTETLQLLGDTMSRVMSDLSSALTSSSVQSIVSELADLGPSLLEVGSAAWDVTKAFTEGLFGRKVSTGGVKTDLESIASTLRSPEMQDTFRNLGLATNIWASAMIGSSAAALTLVALGGELYGAWVQPIYQIQAAWGLVTDWFSELSWADVGETLSQSLTDGVVSGILAGMGPVGAAVQALGSLVNVGLRAEVDAHSPSRKAFQVGEWVGEGLGGGIRSQNDNARTAAHDLGSSAIGGLGSGATTTVSNVGTHLYVTYNSYGGTPSAETMEDFESRLENLLLRLSTRAA